MGLFKPSQPDPAPKPPDPVRLPSPDDPDIMAARKRRMSEGFGKMMGRQSTDLTSNPSQTPYTRQSLG